MVKNSCNLIILGNNSKTMIRGRMKKTGGELNFDRELN
jgi:hypothetical protein